MVPLCLSSFCSQGFRHIGICPHVLACNHWDGELNLDYWLGELSGVRRKRKKGGFRKGVRPAQVKESDPIPKKRKGGRKGGQPKRVRKESDPIPKKRKGGRKGGQPKRVRREAAAQALKEDATLPEATPRSPAVSSSEQAPPFYSVCHKQFALYAFQELISSISSVQHQILVFLLAFAFKMSTFRYFFDIFLILLQ